MMHRQTTITFLLTTLLAGCAKQEPPPAQTMQPTAMPAPAAEDSADVTRGKLNAGGVAATYAAHFESEKLVRLKEERRAPSGGAFNGEYTYQGARLLRYRGTKLAGAGAQERPPATLDLEFDLQGALHSGQGPDVTDQDVAAIRNRAQLLRSHALAQRASRGHGSY